MSCHLPLDRKCLEFSDKRSRITVEEKGRKYIGLNLGRKLFSKYRVDGCLIKEGRRCDYLVVDCDGCKAYFIELKGSDLLRAVEQIDHSIDLLKKELAGYVINVRIVLTRVQTPDLKSTKFIKLQKKIRQLKGDILNREKILEENV